MPEYPIPAKPRPWLVLDVESIGLHGEGFAVAFVVLDSTDGSELATFYAACPPEAAVGDQKSRLWLEEHCLPGLPPPTHKTPLEVWEAFWSAYSDWRARGCEVFADTGWPVEARFFIACVDDNRAEREWTGPYPLQEIQTTLWAKGLSKRWETRLSTELPAHNPLADSRFSARLLRLAILGKGDSDE